MVSKGLSSECFILSSISGDVRNDLYLMLDRAELERGKKTAGKNVEVTVHVIDGNNKKMVRTWDQ